MIGGPESNGEYYSTCPNTQREELWQISLLGSSRSLLGLKAEGGKEASLASVVLPGLNFRV